MIIAGIDTGKIIGYAVYDTDNASIELRESDDIREVKEWLFQDNPGIILFERIMHYGLGMDSAVIRAASEIGFFVCVAYDINAQIIYYTARQWKNKLIQPVKITKEERARCVKQKKITDTQIKNKLKEIFNLEKIGYHSSTAAGLIYIFLQEGKND